MIDPVIDYDVIKSQVNEVLCHAANVSRVPALDDYMKEWRKNKERFIKMFNDQLIVEIEEDITFTLTDEEKEKKFDDFVRILIEDSYYKPSDILDPKVVDFINNNHDSFYDNTVTWAEDSSLIGMKLTRALKFFIHDKAVLDAYQTEMSRILQQNKVTGKFCLSVHPLDYLSSSENVSNWRSCHALDGEYAAGNLSYMMDPSTIVCYLRSSEGENYHLPHFPSSVTWNNKKWRMLLHVNESNNALIISRQYPFFTSEGPNLAKQVYETVSKKHFSDFYYKPFSRVFLGPNSETVYSLNEKYIVICGEPVPLKTLVHEVKNSMNYNDVLYSSVCDPQMALDIDLHWCVDASKVLPFEIGHAVKCVECGYDLLDSEMGGFRCPNCAEPREYCVYCGDPVYEDDDIHWLNGEPYCDHCWDMHVSYCEHCDSYVVDDDMRNDMCEHCNEQREEIEGD